MPQALIIQLRFARSEFYRALQGITNDDAVQRFIPMNSISWNVGHLAWQEQKYWLEYLQARVLFPELNENFCNGCPAHTPPFEDMVHIWQTVTSATDSFLDQLSTEELCMEKQLVDGSKVQMFTMGSWMLRVIYHYWYHIGENMAIRQMLGHHNLPSFVGKLDTLAPYKPQ